MINLLWNLMIYNKAFKEVRPLTMELIKEIGVQESGIWPFNTRTPVYTGRFIIRFMYDKGPGSNPRHDDIVFDKLDEAKHWYNKIYNDVFINKSITVTPPPPPPKKPQGPKDSKRLHLV